MAQNYKGNLIKAEVENHKAITTLMTTLLL